MMQGPGLARVTIERLGMRGEGVATLDGRRLYVPYALPGDVVSVDRDGERGTLVGVIEPSPERVVPFCRYYATCGGCAIQALAEPAYANWKRGLLVAALDKAGVLAGSSTGGSPAVLPLVDAHGTGRRRATFHSRTGPDGRVRVGFMQARAHAIVQIDRCPILDPGLADALPAARALAEAVATRTSVSTPPRLRDNDESLDILCTATDGGLDIDLRGHGPLDDDERTRLVSVALDLGLARLSNHGTVVLERRKPTITMGNAVVQLPPGAFLQATAAGESILAERVISASAGARRVADLFSGIGTFALRIAVGAEVTAIDTHAAALTALERAARATPGLRSIDVQTRDLQRRPLTPDELKPFDVVCLDPPRAGAEAQMRAIAASAVRTVISVSCDPATFARDAAFLLNAGFIAGEIVPVDQFRHSAHLEIVAVFHRAPAKRKRRLLG